MLHSLGNAVVPACAEELGYVILQIDEYLSSFSEAAQ
jgi:hypothetical protein